MEKRLENLLRIVPKLKKNKKIRKDYIDNLELEIKFIRAKLKIKTLKWEIEELQTYLTQAQLFKVESRVKNHEKTKNKIKKN